MGVSLIFKIAAVGILVAVLNQLLSKSGRDEQAMLVTLAGLIVVLLAMIGEIKKFLRDDGIIRISRKDKELGIKIKELDRICRKYNIGKLRIKHLKCSLFCYIILMVLID